METFKRKRERNRLKQSLRHPIYLIILCGLSSISSAQISHSVSLQSFQDSILVVDAGEDTAFSNPADVNVFVLGGSPSAIGGSFPYRFEWSPSSALDNDSIANPQIINQTTGQQTYTLTVFDDRNCTAVDSVIITLLFISSLTSYDGAKLNIYPNPAHSSITVELPHNTGTLKFYDGSGRVVQSINVTDFKQQINVRTLASGMYTLEYQQSNNRLIQKIQIN